MAHVIPLYKSGSVDDPSNYRPVSLLPTVDKVVESVVCSQLMAYLLEDNILT